MNRRVGIRDVAQHAGVSIATVSNVLNRPDRVSDELRERVSESADELGYVPMPAARALRAGNSGLIGLTVINVANPFYGSLIAGAESAAATAGMRVFAGNIDDDAQQERDHLGLFDQLQVEGALISPFADTRAAVRGLRGHGIPVVLVDAEDEDGQLSSVSFDNRAAAAMAARHVIELGRRRVLFAGSRREVSQVRAREAGARDAVEAAGLTLVAERLPTTDPISGLAFGARLIAMEPDDRPDAVLCSNDHLAAGVVRALTSAGVRVPEDIAVVGYDDTPLAQVAAVPLTTVRQPAFEMGHSAAQMLIARIRDPHLARETVVFAPELVVRASTTG
ncbi:MAG: LacI family DNA-binding transcriptional regulator [Microbacterium gubbeenense]|uniref:LacI family DNA-binding transcriptional regulator n=1 Tax=Microbacterium gubbeenense TaxID=159896 RepID=UPI00048AE836|nr:LacI family DNA-binding transcriptional regulator [Microbacterium gubbeenense]